MSGRVEKFTPVPWSASEPQAGYAEIRANGRLVFALAHPGHDDGDISDEEKSANLALIAAAPDLYRELNHLVNVLEASNTHMGATVNAARAALSRARGETRAGGAE